MFVLIVAFPLYSLSLASGSYFHQEETAAKSAGKSLIHEFPETSSSSLRQFLYPPDDDRREARRPSALVRWPAAWKVGRRDSARWHVSGGALRTADRSPLGAGTAVLQSLLGTRSGASWNPIRASALARARYPAPHRVHRALMGERRPAYRAG